MTPLRSLFAALLLPLCATAAQAQEWKEIRFGVFPEYPPFESVAADGSLQGFDIELGNAICAKLEAQLNFLSKPEGADFKTGPAFKDPTLALDIAMGLRKNDQDLRALINKGIAAVQADGTYAQIQKKYFGDQDIYNE